MGSSPHREASPGPGAKEVGQGKDLLEGETPEDREGKETSQDRPGRGAGQGETPVPGECAACQPCLRPSIYALFLHASSRNVAEPG